MILRLKLDENVPQRVEPALMDMGIDVATARSEGLAGSADPVLLAACTSENRILVTLDLDFSNIREYIPGTHRGIWVLRPARQTFDAIASLVHSAVRFASVEHAAGQLWIIDERQIRIRE